MESEVATEVLRVLTDRYLAAGAPGITDVIKRLGVVVTREGKEQLEYAWKLPGGSCLVTIWAEDVRVHPSGRWFYVDSLDIDHRRGGEERGPWQRQRAINRVAVLQHARRPGQECIGLLQTNLRSIEELEQNEDAKVSRRVKDDERWHVATWDEERQRAVLVRGERNWAPTPEDIDGAPAPAFPPEPDTSPPPMLVFPDKAHRDKVEAAAIEEVTRYFRRQQLKVDDVSKENRGYDLEILDQVGKPVLHVEVKGISMLEPGFFLTRNEFLSSQRLETWRLAIVTSALTEPAVQVLTAQEMTDGFGFEPLVWRCNPRQEGQAVVTARSDARLNS